MCYEIKTNDFYKDINPDVHSKFDTSAYPPLHPSGIKTGVNKKVIGMMKDECSGEVMTEFVGLRRKLYTTKMDEGKEDKKSKGVKKAVVRNKITFEDYKQCLYTAIEQTIKVNRISSHKHTIYSEESTKVALSSNDDKRIILHDGVHTLAYGHHKKNILK